ncbi:MAG: efflux RND transporter periplasmic adaptor subunit [Alphaproteobacteria bacterium]|nr:efflux RND transporter periplasmic adaptor subunit [Alphaproteobacteria bacterium]
MVRLALAVVIVVAAGAFAFWQISSRPEPPERANRERSFTVAALVPVAAAHTPKIFAFGEVVAGRTIDMRSQVSGEVITVSPNLVVGGRLAENDVLLAIDPFIYDGALADAKIAVADTRLQLSVAQEQLAINETNLVAAEQQYDLSVRDFERAASLLAAGSATDKQVDDRALIVAQRRQSLDQTMGSIRVQTATIQRQRAAISRAEWVVAQAERAVQNTTITAPFDAIVTAQSAQPGRVIAANEIVASLYATNSLEVRFTLSDRQYGQLVSAGLIGREIVAEWDIEPVPVSAAGIITRVGAEVDATFGGVEVFARLAPDPDLALRPGTFVSVSLDGITFENALRLPETALYENDHIYRIQDGRMARLDVRLLARDGAHVIVGADLPAGARIITTRLAQAGEGVKVNVEGEEPPAGDRPREGSDDQGSPPVGPPLPGRGR